MLPVPGEKRQAEASRIRERYLDRIHVIAEKAEGGDVPDIDKKKLVSLYVADFELLHTLIFFQKTAAWWENEVVNAGKLLAEDN
ncbi:hypothetical protein Ancab_004882 [Ancistrocladus abbreviatus]